MRRHRRGPFALASTGASGVPTGARHALGVRSHWLSLVPVRRVGSPRWWQARVRRLAEAPPRWWQELLILGVGFYAYTRVQQSLPTHPVAALRNGEALWNSEGRWHLRAEPTLNHGLVAHPALAVVANYYYVLLHLGITLVILLWLYRWHRLNYRRARLVLFAASLVALIVFWQVPTAPPRLVPHTGLVDIVAVHHTWGAYEAGALKTHADLLASMPSLHVGWALWCGIEVARFARVRVVRWLGAAYPVVTSLDVLATANHYLLDIGGGFAVIVIGIMIEWVLTGESVAALPASTAGQTPKPAHVRDGLEHHHRRPRSHG